MHFNINSRFWQFLTLCTRFFILNILFVVTIIPVITIGPARAALYSTVFAYDDHDDIDLGREYMRRFVREFARAIGSSLIFVVAAAIITLGIAFWNSLGTDVSYGALPVLIIGAVIVLTTFEYYFPLQARYESSFRNTWSNALRLPWAVFGKTVAIIGIDIAASCLFVFTNRLRVAFVLLGFSWLAYAKSLIYLKIFAQIDNKDK